MESVDWQTGKTSLTCSKYMLENQINCDVNFRVGENEEIIKAHKFILSMRSAVFERMFNGSFCESDTDPVILDVTPAAFKMLLRYCYYECDIEDDVAFSVLYGSTKYMLPLLEEAARKKVIETLSVSNIWDIYKYSIDVGDIRLLNGCRRFFQENITPVKEALRAEAFLNTPHKVLLEFLHINDQVDSLSGLNQEQIMTESNTGSSKTGTFGSSKASIVYYKNNAGISISEIELFKACNEWAEAECVRQEIETTGANKRTVLGDCLSLIRFPTMLPKDLVTEVYPTGILTQSEIINLVQYMHRDEGVECQVDFPSSDRQFVVTAPEFSEISADISTVSLESAERVKLSRLWIRGAGSYKVTLSNLTSDVTWSMKFDAEFHGHATKVINKIRKMLHFIDMKPQLLEPGTKYSLTAQKTKSSDNPDHKLVTKWVHMEDLLPFKEVKLTTNLSKANTIYALTLCLV